MKNFLMSFVYAARGIAFAARGRNFRFHLCAAAFVTYFAARFYELSRAEWAVLFVTFAAVLTAETVNTAVECLADRVTEAPDEKIRRCKDCAAGAVLITAVFSVAVGWALFGDTERLSAIWIYFSEEWYRAALLLCAAAAAWAAVFLPGISERRRK